MPGTLYVPKDSISEELGQLTFVAKHPDSAAHSSGFENVDCEIQLPVYQNRGFTMSFQHH
jgi:hypothetical protein